MLVIMLCGLAALVAGSPIDDGVNKLANGTEGYYKTYLFLKSVVFFGLKVHLLTNNLISAFLLPDIEPFSYQRKVKIGSQNKMTNPPKFDERNAAKITLKKSLKNWKTILASQRQIDSHGLKNVCHTRPVG